jgi:ankyrin repeat protein
MYDTDVQSVHGHSLLHLAASQGHEEVAQLLVKWGADVNARLLDGSTSLHLASQNRGHLNMIRTLVKLGAIVNERDNAGWTPFHSALSCGRREEAVRTLAELGADRCYPRW